MPKVVAVDEPPARPRGSDADRQEVVQVLDMLEHAERDDQVEILSVERLTETLV